MRGVLYSKNKNPPKEIIKVDQMSLYYVQCSSFIYLLFAYWCFSLLLKPTGPSGNDLTYFDAPIRILQHLNLRMVKVEEYKWLNYIDLIKPNPQSPNKTKSYSLSNCKSNEMNCRYRIYISSCKSHPYTYLMSILKHCFHF